MRSANLGDLEQTLAGSAPSSPRSSRRGNAAALETEDALERRRAVADGSTFAGLTTRLGDESALDGLRDGQSAATPQILAMSGREHGPR